MEQNMKVILIVNWKFVEKDFKHKQVYSTFLLLRYETENMVISVDFRWLEQMFEVEADNKTPTKL
jgi:hypothetical protein